jgi:hypothetical protein
MIPDPQLWSQEYKKTAKNKFKKELFSYKETEWRGGRGRGGSVFRRRHKDSVHILLLGHKTVIISNGSDIENSPGIFSVLRVETNWGGYGVYA